MSYHFSMTEYEKMIAGLIYDCSDPELQALQRRLNALNEEWNALPSSSPKRAEILRELAPNIHPSCWLRGPVYFDYGCNVYMGEKSYANYGFTALDVCPIHVGKGVHIGTNVSLLTPLHPIDADERAMYVNASGDLTDKEYGAPIVIGDHCWLASNVTVLPGVTIGRNTVIGAGSVVTHDIPEGVLAAGNPCKVIRKITAADKLQNHPELFPKE